MRTRRTKIIAAMLTLLVGCAEAARAQNPVPPASGIWQSGNSSYALSAVTEQRLLVSLKRITGVEHLAFAADGRLEIGEAADEHQGSAIARQILRAALASGDIFVVEDHSSSPTVNFGEIERMDYANGAADRQNQVWWIRLDFEDFRDMTASPRVRAAFDEGLTLLHEILHALGCHDPTHAGELGECETLVNRVRSEVGLPLRVEYFATPVSRREPGVVVTRLRFRDSASGQPDRGEQDLFSTFSVLAPSTSTAFVQQRSQ